MNWFVKTLSSSIGKKVLVGLTGLLLFLYLIIHLIGNLTIYGGSDLFNSYANTLSRLPIVPLIEAGLLVVFLIHIVLVSILTLENRRARGNVRYAVRSTKRKEKTETFVSRTMYVSGVIVFIFLVVHIYDFRYQLEHDSNLADMLFDTLTQPGRAVLYIIGALLIGYHMFHGIQSGFRSMGINHPKYTPIIDRMSFLLSIIIGISFATIPLFIFLEVIK